MDLSIMDTRNGRIPTGLEKKNSIDVQTATETQRRTENNGESVPTTKKKEKQIYIPKRRPARFGYD